MNALVPLDNPFIRLLTSNLLILAIICVSDYFLFHDRLDLLDEAKRNEMKADLKERFGIQQIKKIQVSDIDTLKGRAKIKVWIHDADQHHMEG